MPKLDQKLTSLWEWEGGAIPSGHVRDHSRRGDSDRTGRPPGARLTFSPRGSLTAPSGGSRALAAMREA